MDVDGLKIALLQKIIACKDEALLKKIEALLQNIKIEVNEPHEDYEVEKHKSLLSAEQLKELERRSKAYESGEEKALPWEEVKKDIEKKYGL